MNTEVDEVEDVDDDLSTSPVLETPTPEPEVKETPEWEKAIAKLTETITKDREPKPEQPAKLTPEQESEMWAIFDPKKDEADFMKKFFRLNPDATPEEEAAAEKMFAKVQKGFVKQSVKSSINFTQAALQKVREEFAPVLEYVSQQKAQATRGRFNDAYPELAEPEYEDILRLAAEGVGGKKFADEAEYFKAVAETAAKPIAKINPAFVLGAGKTTTKKSTGTSAKLPLTKVGGSGGTGGGKSVPSVPHGQDASGEIFDE